MLIRVRKAVVYLLVTALMATGMSRVVVAAELGENTVFEAHSDAKDHNHAHHNHDLQSDDIGTWACLKYCVERAPDAGMIAKASLSGFVSSDEFGLLFGPASANSSVFIDTSHIVLPRGPPRVNYLRAPQKQHDILLRTARFRI